MKAFREPFRYVSGTILLILAMTNLNMTFNLSRLSFYQAVNCIACFLMGLGLFIRKNSIDAVGAFFVLIGKISAAGGFEKLFALIMHFKPTESSLILICQMIASLLMIACCLAGKTPVLPILTAFFAAAGWILIPAMHGSLTQYFSASVSVLNFFYSVLAEPVAYGMLAFAVG